MSIQLTPEQERRIRTVVNAGAYGSTEEAIDVAVAAVELAAAPGFEGTQEELEVLLQEGINSGAPIAADEKFWNRLGAEINSVAMEHRAGKSHR